MANSTVHTRRGIGVFKGLTTVRGGEGSPVVYVRAVPGPTQLGFWLGKITQGRGKLLELLA
jgi:hypothetical protein